MSIEEQLSRIKKIKIAKHRDVETKAISEEELKQIVDYIERSNLLQGQKDLLKTYYPTQLYQGQRVGESIDLMLDDVDLVQRVIHIRGGKGRKDRIIGINKAAYPQLKAYKEQLRPDSEHKNFFLKPDGEPLDIYYIEKITKKITSELGLPSGLHAFRRGMATYYADKGVPLHHIQEMLGHSSIQVTMQYVKPNRRAIVENMADW